MIKEITDRVITYNHWANEVLIQWLQTLDENILYKYIPSSFPGIDLTLQHVIHSQNFWFTILTEGDINTLDERIKQNAAPENMRNILIVSENIKRLCINYDELALLHRVTNYATMQPRYEFILHFVNHNTYHRGQIITMARGLGITENIPLTDYEYYLQLQTG